MRPASLRRDRQKQFNYMTQEEYDQELKKQIEEKRMQQMQEKMQNQQEILNHYKNYQLGADDGTGEDLHYLQDLNKLVQNKEREIERLGMGGNFQGQGRNEVFQGDMNAFVKQNQTNIPQPGAPIFGNDKRQFDLFSDNFVQGYKQQQNKNNENLNIINSIFGNQNPSSVNIGQPSNAETERERRLKLREMERMKRQEGLSGGGYGVVEAPTQQQPVVGQTQMNIFGPGEQKPQSVASKRDQIWQQKMQQRLNSQEGHRVPLHQPTPMQNVASMLPINQLQGIGPISLTLEVPNTFSSPDHGVRSSRILNNLSDARRLDQSINLEQKQPPATSGFLQLGGDDDLIKKRRENEKRQKQQEYQEFLRQKQGLSKPPGGVPHQENPIVSQNVSTTVPSSSQSNQRPSYRSGSENNEQQQHNVFQNGGLQQLGMHQQKQQEDKLKMQREYKQMLDMQNQQKANHHSANYQIPQDRKKELSDQVFNEILGSHQKFAPSNIMPLDAHIDIPPFPMRNHSAVGQQRPDPSQQQQDQGLLTKLVVNDEEKKKQALEKKREYAMQLQQQMMLKQQQSNNSGRGRRGTSQVIHQQPQIQNSSENLSQGYQNKKVFEYQQQPQLPINIPLQSYYVPQTFDPVTLTSFFQQQDPYFQPQPPMFNQAPFMNQQPPMMLPSQIQPNIGFNPIPQNGQTPTNQVQPDAKEMARLKQEEYRRELEMQIKLKEEQKRLKQMDEQLYDQKKEKEIQQMVHQVNQPIRHASNPNLQQNDFSNPNPYAQQQQQPLPQSTQNFVRQRTDVSKRGDPQDNEDKVLKQMQYQAELQMQMEEKKRQKEEEKRKKKMEDEEHERKIQKELEALNHKDHQELVKEGRRDPNAPYQAPKPKQVRRDQFEPSQENPNVQAAQNQEWQKPSDVQKESLFGNDQKTGPSFEGFPSSGMNIQLPINNRREDLFGGGQPSNLDFQKREIQPSYGGPQLGMPQSNLPFYNDPQPIYPQQQVTSNSFNQPDPSVFAQQKMMEEQSKMIQMYQQALEQILQFRNQYFEQAMQMREHIVKEREQLLEYEKMKQQQAQEINQLQAVYNQLGSILNTTTQRPISSQSQMAHQNLPPTNMATPILNPQVQNNLNNLIISQKQQIMRLSQSGGFNFKDKMQQLYPSQQQYQMQTGHDEQPNILEQSLSSDTKFVHIPQNKLQQMAQSTAGAQLFQTWKQDQLIQQQPQVAQQQMLAQAQVTQSLTGSSQLFNNPAFQSSGLRQPSPNKLGSQKINHLAFQSRPQTSNPPETIQELPKEEDEQVNQSRSTLNAQQIAKMKEEEVDFNSRESSNSPPRNPLSKTNSRTGADRDHTMQTMQNNMITNTNPLGNTSTIQENMLQIEKMLGQKQNERPQVISPTNKTQEKFQNATGSSFYNQTMYQQKQQEQTQMEELQKQLMRIFGNTQQSENTNIVQLMQMKPATPLVNQQRDTQQFVNPLQKASYNEKLNTLSPEEKDILAQSNINIAESVTGTQNMNEIIQRANQKFSSNGFYQGPQFDNQIIDETKVVLQSQDDEEVQEVRMNEKPKIQDSNKYGTKQFEESQIQDVWNDPDLVPPPVVKMDGGDDDYYFEPQINQSAINPYSSQIDDGTLKNLQMFSPPSDEHNYNLGQYEQSQQDEAYDGTMTSQQTHQQDPKAGTVMSTKSANRRGGRDIKDIMEVAKLIQQATDTTNSLFENSDNFKFKIKRDQIKEGSEPTPKSTTDNKKPQLVQQNSRKNIKTVDPFKNADQKHQNTTISEKPSQPSINLGMAEEDKDCDILSNLDKMILNLQAQQQKCRQINTEYEETKEPRGRPFSGVEKPEQRMDRSKSNKKNRPISAYDDQPQKLGKYAQMALQQQQVETQSHQRSQKSVGRFTQMAMAGTNNPDLINEVAEKYADDEKTRLMQEQYMNLQNQYQQQQILRPVSGKSNSTRYQKPQSQQSHRNKSNPGQPQMFYDEESDDYVNLSNQNQQQYYQQQQLYSQDQQYLDYYAGQPDVEEDQNMGTSGFNIGYDREVEEEQQ